MVMLPFLSRVTGASSMEANAGWNAVLPELVRSTKILPVVAS